MKTTYIGTSGFSYSSWKNNFYPEKLPSSRWLDYYSGQFNTLELNNTFYRFPVLKHLQKLFDTTPEDFKFSVKVNKVITHTLRMKEVRGKVEEFTRIVDEGLQDKLGCILFQLPPSFAYSEEKLQLVLDAVPHESRCVVEFRHTSWWNDTVAAAFRQCNLTFCNVSYPGLPEEIWMTSEKFYMRLHGVPELFISSYSATELEKIQASLPPEAQQWFIYFNNTMYEAGYSNAYALQSLVKGKRSLTYK